MMYLTFPYFLNFDLSIIQLRRLIRSVKAFSVHLSLLYGMPGSSLISRFVLAVLLLALGFSSLKKLVSFKSQKLSADILRRLTTFGPFLTAFF